GGAVGAVGRLRARGAQRAARAGGRGGGGPKGKHNPDRIALRHGQEDGEVTNGGRRVPVKRPRARSADGESEVPLVTYEHFADRDQLEDVVLERMLAGVSTRKYRRAQEP